MGVFLPNTTSPDAYPSSPQLGGLSTPYERGQILIANNPVVLTVYRGSDRGSITEDEYSYVTPSLIPLVRGQKEYVYGVKFRNAIAGAPAQVSGYLIEPGVAGLGAGSAFTQQVGSGGGVTPGQASVQIQHNGALVGTEPILDFIDVAGGRWALADDGANTRVTVSRTGYTVSNWSGGPPAAPTDGDMWLALNVGPDNVAWLFVWIAGDAVWRFIGGPAWQHTVNVNTVMINDSNWHNDPNLLSFTGRHGNYQASVSIGWFNNAGGFAGAQFSPGVNGTPVIGCSMQGPNQEMQIGHYDCGIFLTNNGDVITSQYNANGITGMQIVERTLKIAPEYVT